MAQTTKLSNGHTIPTLGLGTWQSAPGEVYDAVKIAIDVGYRHFDCAMLYANEAEIGAAIREKIQEGVVKREDLFITSKLWNTYHRPEVVVATCKKSLQSFGLDYLDLYLIHWPVAFKSGDDFIPRDGNGKLQREFVDLVDTWREMEQCAKLGLTRSIGVSNFNSQQVERIIKNATIKPVMNQVECHVYLNQKKLIAFCNERGVAVTAYSPLGAPNVKAPPKDMRFLLEDKKLKELAQKYGKSLAQVVLRYLVQIGTIVIPKSVHKNRLEENFNLFDFEISPEDMAYIDTFNCNFRTCPFDESIDDENFPFSIEF